MKSLKPYLPLLTKVKQYEVDFVIPRNGIDLPLGIDPFLLYKSRDSQYQQLHVSLLRIFNMGIDCVKRKDMATAEMLLDFPEVSEIGLGYTRTGKRGAGVGELLRSLIIQTLMESPALLDRGIRHIEEMQLVSLGIGPDRVSDIAANILKIDLIRYTQEQCALWNINLEKGVPVHHVFDPIQIQWYDDYFDLPISPIDQAPILFVPRRIVRSLPWINYNDYFRMEFTAYLRAKRARGRLMSQETSSPTAALNKQSVITITRTETERIDRYIDRKEATSELAQPTINFPMGEDQSEESDTLKQRLRGIPHGIECAKAYQCLILEILNYLFVPDLISGEMEETTLDGTERRDIVFTNDSDKNFWEYLRINHKNFLVMLETKNTKAVEIEHINQTAQYLGDRMGYCGMIISREAVDENRLRKIYSVYNDSSPRKIILTLSDQDINNMLDLRCQGKDPTNYMQKVYRNFIGKAQ
jgi:hypothetical protein